LEYYFATDDASGQSSSKNQNPREGIETNFVPTTRLGFNGKLQKNQNPREGIETRYGHAYIINNRIYSSLQKTKIPARGLKRGSVCRARAGVVSVRLQKTKIPARGLKQISKLIYVSMARRMSSKNQNPREGIETIVVLLSALE